MKIPLEKLVLSLIQFMKEIFKKIFLKVQLKLPLKVLRISIQRIYLFQLQQKIYKKIFNSLEKYFKEKKINVSSKSLNFAKHKNYASIHLQVPKDNYMGLKQYLEGNFEIESKNINIANLKKNVESSSSRLKRYEEQVKKYTFLLKEENLEIEDEIKINSRIDTIENQIYYIRKELERNKEQINLVDVYISLSQKNPYGVVEFKSFNEILSNFISALIYVFNLFFVLLGYLVIPVILFLSYIFLRKCFFQKISYNF